MSLDESGGPSGSAFIESCVACGSFWLSSPSCSSSLSSSSSLLSVLGLRGRWPSRLPSSSLPLLPPPAPPLVALLPWLSAPSLSLSLAFSPSPASSDPDLCCEESLSCPWLETVEPADCLSPLLSLLCDAGAKCWPLILFIHCLARRAFVAAVCVRQLLVGLKLCDLRQDVPFFRELMSACSTGRSAAAAGDAVSKTMSAPSSIRRISSGRVLVWVRWPWTKSDGDGVSHDGGRAHSMLRVVCEQ